MENLDTTAHVIEQNSGTAIMGDISAQAENIAFRDVNIFESKAEFSTIKPELFENDDFVPPLFAQDVLQKVLANRIIVIGGGYDFDKADFALHIALSIQQQNPDWSIQDSQYNSDSLDLLKMMRKVEQPSVFLLEDLHPQGIDYDFDKLKKITHERAHFVIITTDSEPSTWSMSEANQKQHWFDIPESNHYSKEAIAELFVKSFSSQLSNLPFEVDGDVALGVTLTQDKTIGDLASHLSSPREVSFVIDQLCEYSEPPSDNQLSQIVKDATDTNTSLISHWFKRRSRKEQLIIISALLLEGMYDDQYFSVVEDVTEDFWENSVQSIQSLDYHDLDFLSGFFRFESRGDEQFIVIKSPKQRHDLMTTAWESHRRHIMAVFPKMLSLINRTLRKNEMDWEKFGTRQRRMVLRDVVGKTISDIGLVSFASVQPVLLEMAAHHEKTLQIITAKALARWREYGKEEELFRVLNQWLEDDQIESLVEEYLKKKELSVSDRKLSSKAPDFIKATTVMTLGYAAKYDQPNQLHSEIISRFKQIIHDPSETVKVRVIDALPKIIHHHSVQLKNDLVDHFMTHEDLTEAIGIGLARAYETYPKDLKSTISYWLQDCLAEGSKENRRLKATKRDNVLITILNTFRNIDFQDTENTEVTPQYVFDVLEQLQHSEKRSIVRLNMVDLAAHLAMLDFDETRARMESLFAGFTRKEQLMIVSVWSSLFVEQRKQLTGNDYFIRVHKEEFPAWLNVEDRPLTGIEKTMFEWLESSDKHAKIYATLAFIAFAQAFEEEEKVAERELIQRQERLRQEQKAFAARMKAGTTTVKIQQDRGLSILKRLYIWFMLWFENKENKEAIRAVVKFLLNTNHYSKVQLAIVFDKWRKKGNKPSSKLAVLLWRLFR